MSGIDDIEVSQALADTLGASGQLLAFFGPMFGGMFFGAISVLFAIGAIRASEDLQRQIDEDLFRRTSTTAATTARPTTLDPSKSILGHFSFFGSNHLLILRIL